VVHCFTGLPTDTPLRPRQGGGAPIVAPAATLAGGLASPVTIYAINVQVGATAVQSEFTYTQLFSPVPDQWPSARAGQIGYGSLQKQKRNVPAQAQAQETGIAGRIRLT